MTESHGKLGAHEQTDAAVRPILTFGVVLVFIIIASLVALTFLFRLFTHREALAGPQPSSMNREGQIPPLPRLQVSPPRDLRALRKAEDDVINSYGWVDRNAGRVRIPIDRAMELMAQRGLPVGSVQRGGVNK
jgi:hypothetical protein